MTTKILMTFKRSKWASLYFDMEQTCFLCITVLFSSTELSANAVVHICELCIHIFVTIFTEFSIKYTALARLYTFDMKQTCFLHRRFLFFNRLSRALCQCSGLQYYVFLCMVFLLALKELYTWYCPMTIQRQRAHFLNTHRSLITTLSIDAVMTLLTVISMKTKIT